MRSMSIGQRITLWYGIIVALFLSGFGVAVYLIFSHTLTAEIDRAIDEELAEVVREVEVARSRDEMLRQLERNFQDHGFYEIQVATPRGQPLFRTRGLTRSPIPVRGFVDDGVARANMPLETGERHDYRVGTRHASSPIGPLVVQVADPLTLYHTALSRLLTILCTLTPVVLIVSVTGGYWLSRRALAPIRRMMDTVAEIGVSQLGHRLEVANPDDELGRLATTINAMFERLQRAVEEIKRFTADAAHEFRTPLAVLRTEAEVALRYGDSSEAFRDVVTRQLDEVCRLSRLADQLLFLCREDAGVPADRRDAVRVDHLIEDLCEQMQPAARRMRVELSVEPLPAAVLESDEDRVRRLFANLLENALKYTSARCRVSVSGEFRQGTAEFAISDTGAGIAPEHLPHLFDRFYRVDAARSGRNGVGLGLAICRSIVESHGGSIAVESAAGSGTTFTVRLPTYEPPQAPVENPSRDEPPRLLHWKESEPAASLPVEFLRNA